MKKITYFLTGIIVLLLISIGFSVFNIYEDEQVKKEKIDSIILGLEENFYKDSINLVNINKILIDKISQKIIDSMTGVYEEKLELAQSETEKYKTLLLEQNGNVNIASSKRVKPSKNYLVATTSKAPKTAPNVTSYSKLSKRSNVTTHSKAPKTTSNVTTYTKLPKSSNVTTYSKLPKTTSNVTTYTKLPKSSNVIPATQPLRNTSIKTRISKAEPIVHQSNKGMMHNSMELNKATNINDAQSVPIYPGCEKEDTEFNKKNCFAIKISAYILSRFNPTVTRNSGLSSGVKKMRVLFIIDENGNTKMKKIVGKWPQKVSKEAKRVVESVPKMQPGILNGNATAIKYSLQIPFMVNSG